MNEKEIKEYEAPEVFELGQAEKLTDGHRFGDWLDSDPPYTQWIWAI